MRGARQWLLGILAALLIAQFALRGEASLRQESPVWDERLHLGYGLALIDRGPSFDGQDHAYPITAALSLPTWLAMRGEEGLRALRLEDPSGLRPARRANLALGTMGLALLAVFAARRRGGVFAVVTLALATTDASWLAQARYVTTDIGQGLGFWLTSWSLLLHCETKRRRWLLLAGLSAGLAVLSKWSALTLPALALGAWLTTTDGRSPSRRLRFAVEAAIVTGAVALSACFVVVIALGAHHGVAPARAVAHLTDSVAASLHKRAEVRGVFLLGHFWTEGTRLYLPVLVLAKTPLAQLLLGVVGVAYPRARALLLRERPWMVVLVGYFVLAVLSGQTLGHRHLTPVLPVLWWTAATALLALVEARRAASVRALATLAGLAAIVEPLLAHPSYLAFTNAAFGGTERAYRVAVDSASDWGQALPMLADYLRDHPPSGRTHLAYFGNAEPSAFVGETVWRPCGPLGWPASRTGARASCDDESADVLAVSATCVYGMPAWSGRRIEPTKRDACWERLRDVEPDAVVGGSILIFRAR